VLPLHVFEPRYRALVADVLKTDGRLAMAVLRPGWESDYEGCPPVYELVAVGKIVWHEPLADGRYEIRLVGEGRALVMGERRHRPYRVARLEPVRETPVASDREGSYRCAVREALRELGTTLCDSAKTLDAVALADEATLALCWPTVRKMEIQAIADHAARIEAVIAGVRQMVEQRRQMLQIRRLGSDDVHRN